MTARGYSPRHVGKTADVTLRQSREVPRAECADKAQAVQQEPAGTPGRGTDAARIRRSSSQGPGPADPGQVAGPALTRCSAADGMIYRVHQQCLRPPAPSSWRCRPRGPRRGQRSQTAAPTSCDHERCSRAVHVLPSPAFTQPLPPSGTDEYPRKRTFGGRHERAGQPWFLRVGQFGAGRRGAGPAAIRGRAPAPRRPPPARRGSSPFRNRRAAAD